MIIENPNYKEQVLAENAVEADMSVINYINHSAANDPGFFRWLFGEQSSEFNDFVCPDQDEFSAFCEDVVSA